MDASALLSGFIDVNVRIDNQWSMYIGVQLAIFWMILMIPRPLLFVERIVAFGGLAIFNYINGWALMISYSLLDVLRIELAETTGGALAKHPLLNNLIQGLDYTSTSTILLITHGGSLSVVGLIIIFQSVIYRHSKRIVAKHDGKISITPAV